MFEPGLLVLTVRPRTAVANTSRAVIAGRVISQEPDGAWLLSANVVGSHMPQRYWADELAPATAELAAQHRLCPSCLGYGLVDVEERTVLCQDCMGSGRQDLYSTVTRDEVTRITRIIITERDVP
jgi:hypothetical protein